MIHRLGKQFGQHPPRFFLSGIAIFLWPTKSSALELGFDCGGPQSALAPAGKSASVLADLFWVMAVGAILIWLLMMALGISSLLRSGPVSRRRVAFYIIGGGALFPTLVLTTVLAYGLSMLPDLVAPAPAGSLEVEVIGHQWWWQVRYPTADGSVQLANEVHLPVDQPVNFYLESSDVIHSFWIPALGGKVDMIPGRRTRLTLHPTKTGIYRGVCAEYCGTSHALMAFEVVVETQEEFERWLQDQSRPAQQPELPQAARGQQLFLANGCGGCHTIRGTSARGMIAPDLTHVGSRLSLAAGILENEVGDFLVWIKHPRDHKPDALMPSFAMLPEEELENLATYLEGLE